MQITRRESFLPLASLFLLPYSLRANAGETLASSNNFEITEVITDPERIDRSKNDAYFKVETRNKGNFYIVQKKDGRVEDVFVVSNVDDERKQGLVFPKSTDSSKPAAVIDASPAGMSGTFNVFEKPDGYSLTYDYFSGLIDVPSHTTVSSKYLIMIDKGIKKLPQSLRQDLYNRGVRLMLGRNIEDTYYHYYPSWKTQDQSTSKDESKPWLEVKGNSCTDHRKMVNISAMYNQKRVMMPQEHLDYNTNKIMDRINYVDSWTFDTVGHELGHAIDFFNTDDYYNNDSVTYSKLKKTYPSNGQLFYKQGAYSHEANFLGAFQIDKDRMESDIKSQVAYLWCKPEGGQQEGFADITACLIGGSNPEKTALTLKAFPLSAEHIRKKVLPDFGVNLTVNDIRTIFPDYLKGLPADFVSK